MADDRALLARAVALAGRCPPSDSAFSVGALVVGPDRTVLAEGWSRRRGPRPRRGVGAGQLGGVVPAGEHRLQLALEPCGRRLSRPRTCAQLILDAGVAHVVFAWREPPVFVEVDGAARLRAGGVEVVEIPELAAAALAPNAHLVR